MRIRARKQQVLPVAPAPIALPLRWLMISSLFLLFAACGKKPEPTPQGWLVNGQPVTSAQNIVLSAGSSLYLPEKFTVEAAADTVVRVTEPKPGMFHIHLLYGTAMLQQNDAATVVTAEVDARILRLRSARFLLQKKAAGTKLFVLDGALDLETAGNKTELAAQRENYSEFSPTGAKYSKAAARDAVKYFPEFVNFRRLVAAR